MAEQNNLKPFTKQISNTTHASSIYYNHDHHQTAAFKYFTLLRLQGQLSFKKKKKSMCYLLPSAMVNQLSKQLMISL